MKGNLRLLNPIASTAFSLLSLILNGSLVAALVFKIVFEDVIQAVVFGILLIVFMPTSLIATRVACWRFYRITDTYIESGGFLRKTTRVYLSDITSVRKESIVVFHGNRNLIDELYEFSSRTTHVLIEINETSDVLVERIKKTNHII